AATVKLPGKLIDHESPPARFGSEQNGKEKRRRKRRRWNFWLTGFSEYGIIITSNKGNSPKAVSTSFKGGAFHEK
ncbi:MAG: hypothetical protein ACLRSW_14130, partial [Christensenellaceae bacterium]